MIKQTRDKLTSGKEALAGTSLTLQDPTDGDCGVWASLCPKIINDSGLTVAQKIDLYGILGDEPTVIGNVGDPTDVRDAATKKYVDEAADKLSARLLPAVEIADKGRTLVVRGGQWTLGGPKSNYNLTLSEDVTFVQIHASVTDDFSVIRVQRTDGDTGDIVMYLREGRTAYGPITVLRDGRKGSITKIVALQTNPIWVWASTVLLDSADGPAPQIEQIMLSAHSYNPILQAGINATGPYFIKSDGKALASGTAISVTDYVFADDKTSAV